MTTRIAMWSGPRNISTAFMRSWENRSDCTVVDEPFYACYLAETGLDHPSREQILRAQSSSRALVIKALAVEDPGSALFYQKLMTHHMPGGTELSWCEGLRHCFLIRDPGYIIASYLQKMPSVSVADIDIVRQLELFEEIADVTGRTPAVINSDDVLRNPASMLKQLCDKLGVSFEPEQMLNWPAGRRDSDGIWADHWYHSVEDSTGFMPYRERTVELAAEQQTLAYQMQPYYQRLAQHRIQP